MDLPRQYDPPEAVVAPAFRELMHRLRTAQVAGTASSIPDEERHLFEHGVAARRRVLEHTLLLTFAQWAVYRQAISRIPWRFARIAYGITAVASTASFTRARAARVTNDLFAHIATSPTDSAVANEARVVLAELEGPDGPFFRSVCRERGFSEDLTSVVATRDAADDHVDPMVSDVHAQLRLRPRLLDADAARSNNTSVVMPHGGVRRRDSGVDDTQDNPQQSRPSWSRRSGISSQWPPPKLDAWPQPPSSRDESWNAEPPRQTIVHRATGEEQRAQDDNRVDAADSGVVGFDFAAAARSGDGETPWAETVEADHGGDGDETGTTLSPAQRRAAERRRRRVEARARSEARSAEKDAM